MSLVYGIGGMVSVMGPAIERNIAPPASFKAQIGQQYIDTSTSPRTLYFYDGQVWQQSTPDTDATFASASDSTTSSSLAIKTYVDGVAVAGAPDASTVTKGIVYLADSTDVVSPWTSGLGVNNVVVPIGQIQTMFAAPPAIGGTTAAAGSFSTLAASGLASLSGSATILTAGTALNLGSDNSGDAVNLAVGTTARTVGIANSAAAHLVTIGSQTGAASLTLQCGTGNFAVTPAATGTITIGRNDGTGQITVGSSSGAQTLVLGGGAGASTINMGNGVGGNTISIGNGNNTSAQTINIANGASAANSTVNILSGNGSAGTQTVNILNGTRAGAFNLATGAAAHVITIGSASAGAVTVDTAAGISLDAATASNFTVTGASADLTLASAGGSVNITASEAAADAIVMNASDGAGGIQLQAGTGGINVLGPVNINVNQNNNVAVNTGTSTGTVTIGNAAAGAIAVDTGAGISLDAATASNFTVTGAGADLTLSSVGGRVDIVATENAAQAVYIRANGGVNETVQIHSDQGTGANSVNILSDAGGITLSAVTSGVAVSGPLKIADTGTGLQIKAGAATDFAGTSTLVNGTVTIANTNIATGDLIFLERIGINGSTALGDYTYTISNATSFTVTSVQRADPSMTETNDDSTFAYFIVRPI